MSETLGDAVLYLRTDNTGLDEGVAAGKTSADQLDSHFQATGKRIANIGQRLTQTVTLGGSAFTGFALKAASDASELQSAFDQTFGKLSGDMNKWAEATGDAMGRSTQEMQNMSKTFGMFFNKAAPTGQAAADLSKKFSVLAQDLSSFFNVDPTVALEKLRSGLSGESEPLRDFGVFLNEATVAQKGLELGLAATSKELTDQDKIVARASLIMEQTKKAQGDVGRTSEGTANKVRAAKAAFEELQVAVGTKLLPVVTPLIGKVTELLNGFNRLPAPVQTSIMALAASGVALGPLMMGLGGIVRVAGPAVSAILSAGAASGTAGASIGAAGMKMGTASTAFAGLLAVLGPFVLPLAAIAAAGALIYANWGKISPVLNELGVRFSEVLGPRVQELIRTLSTILSQLWAGPLGSELKKGVAFLGDLLAIMLKFFGEVVIRAVGALASAVTGAMQVISGAIKIVTGILQGDWRSVWEGAKGIVVAVVRGIINTVDALVPGTRAAVKGVYDGFKQWLVDGLGALVNKVNGRIQALADKFKWLLDVVITHSWVPDLVKGIETWFAKLPDVMVKPAVDAANQVSDAFRNMEGPNVEDWQVREEKGRIRSGGWTVGGDEDPTKPDEETGNRWREGFRNWFAGGLRAAVDGDLGGYLKSWLLSFGDRLLDRFLNSFATAASDALGGLFGGGFSGGFGGGIGGGILKAIGSFFGGGFASGGTLPVGKWGIVGEKGPEPVLSTAKGLLVRPNSSLSTFRERSPSRNVSITIPIDATGADPAQLARVNARMDRLQAELPSVILSTMDDAGSRGMVNTGNWR